MERNLVIYDWVSISTKEITEDDFRLLLGMEKIPFQTIKGMHGYKERLYFSGISIHYNGREDMGVWMEMSGQGCRTFESLGNGDYERLLRWGLKHGNITRLDVAFDDHTGVLDLAQIYSDTDNDLFVSKSNVCDLHKRKENGAPAITVYHGSEKSPFRLRIYDKAKERHCPPGTHWVRVEMQLRDKYAQKFASLDGSIGDNFCGVLLNQVRYVEPMEGDSNRWRWPMKEYWGDFLCEAHAISLYEKPGMEYNLDRLDNYLKKYAGNAIAAGIEAHGLGEFLDMIDHRGTRPNPKYQQLLEELHQRERDSLGVKWDDVPKNIETPFEEREKRPDAWEQLSL